MRIGILLLVSSTLLCTISQAEDQGGKATDWGSLEINLSDLKAWGNKDYTYSLRERGSEAYNIIGTVTLSTELTKDTVLLKDRYQMSYKGETHSMEISQSCRKNNFLFPRFIESKGDEIDEGGSFVATVSDDGMATIRAQNGRESVLELPDGTITLTAMLRLVTLLPTTPGRTYSYAYSLESGEMNLKKKYALTALQPETITVSNTQIACSKFELTGGGSISPVYYWVSRDGVLQRMMMDDRKVMELKVTPDRPNIVFLLSDDQGWADYGFMGHPHIKTPHLDRLAGEGLLYERGYVTAPLCRPSLASLASGLYPHQTGIRGNDPVMPTGKKPTRKNPGDKELWAKMRKRMMAPFAKQPSFIKQLMANGYATLQTGKWWEGNPLDHGFTDAMTHGDVSRGGRHGDEGLKIGRETMKPIYDFVDKAQAKDQPFFIWYGVFLPHSPHDAPDRLYQKYKDLAPDEPTARYWANVDWFDETCGQLVDHLKKKGLYDNTLFVYTCDNGWVPNPEKVGKYVRSKREPVETGIRTPIFLTHKNGIKPQRDAATLASNIDIAPTILRACGIKPDPAMSGLDLRSPQVLAKRDRIFVDVYEHDQDLDVIKDVNSNLTARVVIDGWDKLIARPSGKELYDLRQDPDDRTDISTQQPQKVNKLSTQIDEWMKATPLSNHVPAYGVRPQGKLPKVWRAQMYLEWLPRDSNGVPSEDEFEQRDGLWYFRGESKPFTGKVTVYEKNGLGKAEISYAEGERHGTLTIYKDDVIISKIPYVGGKKHGKAIYCFKDGSLSTEAPYHEGKAHGTKIMYWHNGPKKAEHVFHFGKYMVNRRWNQEGKFYLQKTYRHDGTGISTEIAWYREGQKRSEGAYKDYKKHGVWIFYNENGDETHREDYINGKRID